MPIAQQQMTDEQAQAVSRAISEHLSPQFDADLGDYMAPILPGVVRESKSGAPWVTWHNPASNGAVWYRLMDVLPHGDYQGAQVVLDADARPLGCSDGPLVIHSIRGKWICQPINTGSNLAREIVWFTEDAPQ